MAKKLKFKPTPAGIMFLSAIAVLIIAIIILTVMAIKNCNKNKPEDPVNPDTSAAASTEPVDSTEPSIAPVDSTEPTGSIDPSATPGSIDPGSTASADPQSTDKSGEATVPPVVINTPDPGSQTSAPGSDAPTATPGPTYYTKPTSAMKNNAQKGYVSHDKVNMRKEPNAKATLVKEKIAKNTELTLYVEQEGWWFVKCGDKYGYIKKDYVAKGSAPSTPAPSEATGKVVASTIALRKSPDKSSTCIKQYSSGESLTIYYYKKDSSGRKWYYVKTSDGRTGYMFADYIKVTSGKVGEKS
jgi:uncharacterized protein YgiM (DUF1202 family)